MKTGVLDARRILTRTPAGGGQGWQEEGCTTASVKCSLPTDATAPTSGPEDPSPASLGNPSVQPECGPGSCNVGELPEGEGQPPAAPLSLFFLTLEADWAEARARWGLAWEAHVYGVGTLFGLVALLALLALALLPWRCPPGAPCLALLDVLLLSAGTSRAFPLFYDAYGHRDRLPALAWLLLQDLPPDRAGRRSPGRAAPRSPAGLRSAARRCRPPGPCAPRASRNPAGRRGCAPAGEAWRP